MNQHRETLNDCDKFYFILFICNAQFLKYKMMFWIQMKKSKKKNSEYRIKARKSNDIRTQRIWMNFDRNKNKINKFRTMSLNTHTHTNRQTNKKTILFRFFSLWNKDFCFCFSERIILFLFQFFSCIFFSLLLFSVFMNAFRCYCYLKMLWWWWYAELSEWKIKINKYTRKQTWFYFFFTHPYSQSNTQQLMR